MPPSFRLVPLACLLCIAAGCQRTPDNEAITPAAQEAPPAAGADTVGAATTPSPTPAGVAYACDAGITLARNDDGSFRAEIPGNPAVRLTRITGSAPPVYTGASLYLRIGDGDAMLSQGDGANELHCTAG